MKDVDAGEKGGVSCGVAALVAVAVAEGEVGVQRVRVRVRVLVRACVRGQVCSKHAKAKLQQRALDRMGLDRTGLPDGGVGEEESDSG